MAYHSINTHFRIKNFGSDITLRFIAWLGITLRSNLNDTKEPIKTIDIPKVKLALNIIKDPYVTKPTISSDDSAKNSHYSCILKFYAKVLVFAYHHFYLLLYLLSFIRVGVFDNSTTATDFFHSLYPGAQQSKLCLPRSIFAATTSKMFKKKGCMFIGVFYPSTNLHAWIVEDGRIAYKYDYYWIHFTPIAVMT